ncbi:hypothetical protein [Catenulispora pinisilvae]|uniref:hypothetical protein n=1 Tax=Catenulispora pinisilvae TaxID=2705253 RepID=UPI0018912C0C|nr:hypothetical protein [Catenulispora pinisilvae]
MHSHGRATSANRAPEERETSRRSDNRAPRTAAAAPLSAQNVLALQRAVGNAAVSRLVEAERHSHGPSCGHAAPAATADASRGPAAAAPVQRARAAAAPPAAATPVQRAKTEDERGAHLRRIEMAETAATQLAARIHGTTLADHIFAGRPMSGGLDRNAPQGLHAYTDKKLPSGIQEVQADRIGNQDKVHVITWKYEGRDATKRSTMFPRWMTRDHVLALIALQRGGNVQELPVNASKNVRTSETKPVSAHEIRTHILRGVEINLQVVGDTVYPTHSAF